MSLVCPICTEDMSLSWPLKNVVGQPCCGKMICQSCLYRHLQSVFEEGITASGRSLLKCPFGCGQEVTDKEIRSCIRRQHAGTLWRRLAGQLVFWLLEWMGWFHPMLQDPFRSSRYYNSWMYWCHTPRERYDLYRYEQWSLAVAFRTNRNQMPVQHCPVPDCGYAWVYDQDYRESKLANERKRNFLWYSPPRPEPIDHLWARPEFITETGSIRDLPEEHDGRRMCCAKCHSVFCGLCRRPWTHARHRHRGISCQLYRRRLPAGSSDDGFDFVGQQFNARSCPGCSLRTSRIAGCNHMTCPCGFEWCYVCERSWNPLHYGCRDSRSRNSGPLGCVIS